MKIAYFINEYPGVSHTFIRREIKALEKQGFKVLRYALRGWDSEAVDSDDIEEKGRTCYLLKKGLFGLIQPTLKLLIRSPGKFLKALFVALRFCRKTDRSILYHVIYFAEACKLITLWKTSLPVHVHAHFGTNSAEILLLARILGGPPYSFTVHGPEEFDKSTILHLAEKIEYSKFVVAISSFGRSQLYRCLNHDLWPKVKVVHCGVDKNFHSGVTVGQPSENKFVCVGRLCEQKGQLLLVDAVKELFDRGVKLDLVLAGDGELRNVIESQIKRLKLQSAIRITGWLSGDQVRKEILDSRALVLPSFAEGLPVVIMEAMSLRRPILTTYIAGIPELVINKEHGWLFPAGSVSALANAIEECLNTSDKELTKMASAGYLRVNARHDIDIEVGKLAEFFKAEDI